MNPSYFDVDDVGTRGFHGSWHVLTHRRSSLCAEGQSELGLKEGDVVWVLLDPQAGLP